MPKPPSKVVPTATRRRRIGSIISMLVLAVVLPTAGSYVVYYGFATNYTLLVFHRAGFERSYGGLPVFRYRVLGRELMLWVHALLEGRRSLVRWFGIVPLGIKTAHDWAADDYFYMSYFVLNTAMLVLTMCVLWFLLGMHHSKHERGHGPGLYYSALAMMLLAQFVVAPYDCLSWLLFVVGVALFRWESRWRMPLSLIVMMLATLTRESSALLLSYYFAANYRQLRQRHRFHVAEIAALLATFLGIYIGLRLVIGTDKAVVFGLFIANNLTQFRDLTGVVILVAVLWAILHQAPYRKAVVLFLLASAPYLLAMMLFAITFEIRVWVPVWLGCMLIGHLPNRGCDPDLLKAPGDRRSAISIG